MSSEPQLRTQPRPDEGLPFASYGQVVRMLLPLTGKVCFYDTNGRALWISDGLEEPELRMHVELVITRFKGDEDDDHGDVSDSSEGQPTYVFPIRGPGGALVGALAIVFRDSPSHATYRRIETVERLLAPVLEILSHAWRLPRRAPTASLTSIAAATNVPTLIDPIDTSVPLPALLRRVLGLATHRLQCSFGAFVASSQAFTLSHRASPDDSDLAMNAAIDAVRGPMLKLMQVRREPIVVNSTAPGRERVVPYKFVVLPLRRTSDRLAAVLMLFRSKQDRDFTSVDVQELSQILARIPSNALRELDGAASTDESPRRVEPSQPEAAEPAKFIVPPVPRASTSQTKIPLIVTPDAAAPMDERIRTALRENKFDLVAQRISPLRDQRRPARFEIFVRMYDGDRLRPPSSFFEAAEASVLMPEVDRWVIRRVLTTLREHAAAVRSSNSEFCINIAAQSLTADRFGDFVVSEVCKSSIPAGLLTFEVSECDALEHQYALEFLGARLRDVGCRIALDNCRAGLSTFGPLHRWPVSCVKIDGSLIRNVMTSTRSESIVRAITQLAGTMGIETVAERVESADLRDKLIDIGMDYAQGFHFGQPKPLANLFAGA